MPDKEGSDDEKKSTKSVINKKQKQMMNQEEYLPEEEYDHYKDRMAERGIDISSKDKKDATTSPQPKRKKVKGDTPMQKEFKKKYGKKATALDAVKKDIEDKYGKGAIMEPKKKDKKKDTKEELDLTQVAEAFGGYIIVEKLGKEGEFIPDNPKSSFEKSFSRSKEGKKLKRQQSLTRGSGDFGPSERINPDDKTTQKTQQKVANQRVKTGKKQSTQAFSNKPIDNVDTKQIVRDQSGNPVANPPSESAEAKAKRTKEIKDQSRRTRGSKEPLVDQDKFSTDTRTKSQAPEITGGGARKSDRRKFDRKPEPKPDLKPKVRKSVKGPGLSTGSLERGNLKFSGDDAYQATKKKLAKQQATKVGLRKAAIRKVAKASTMKTAMRAAPKIGGKFLSKRIPFLGAAISGAEAGAKLASGDLVGAGIAGAEAITNIVAPGLDAVIGAAGAARDIRKAGKVAQIARQTSRAARKYKTPAAIAKNVKSKAYGTFMPKMKELTKKVPRSKKTLGLKRPIYTAGATGSLAMTGQMLKGRLKPKVDTGVVGKRTAG